MHTLQSSKVRAFRRDVYRHYDRYGRDLPWRKTTSPYRIVVSEIMLQQTQVDRVIAKYREFIRRFPSFTSLAAASTRDVLEVWQGLGYNRRALMLHKLAVEVRRTFRGRLPRDPLLLRTLPGIGTATAASIAAFAFNMPTVFIETNIRAALIHTFFPRHSRVPDTSLLPLVEQTLDRKNPARWYNALMDYGAMLKKKHANPSRRSAHHVRQARFEGSDRQLRGRILRRLIACPEGLTAGCLATECTATPERINRIVDSLLSEGFLRRAGRRVVLA